MPNENLISIPEPKEEESKEAGSFVRWQTTTRLHLGATINLILTLTLAALGFAMNVLIPKESGSFYATSYARGVIKWSLLLLITAALFGICVNLKRLFDFRWTTRSARIQDIARSYANQGKAASRQTTSDNGQRSLSIENKLRDLPAWVDRLGGASEGPSALRTLWKQWDVRHGKPKTNSAGWPHIRELRKAQQLDLSVASGSTPAPPTPDPIADDLRSLQAHLRQRADLWGRTTWFLFPAS